MPRFGSCAARWWVVWAAWYCVLSPAPLWAAEVKQVRTDLLIVGGTESGWAAAIQAARQGVRSITIVHDGAWLGGQYTEQALACVDENKGVGKVGWGVDWHPMKRSFHRSGLFKELMDGIEAFNAGKYGDPMPGRPYHGPSTFRPVEAEAIFRQLLQPYIDSGQVRLHTGRYPVRADVTAAAEGRPPRLTGLWFAEVGKDAADLHVQARLTIDASDWGEAIQVAGAAFECGPDPQARYGEVSAPVDLSRNPPNEMNPITWAMIVVETDGASPIQRPPRFDDRNYPRATPFSLAAFRDLDWDHPNPGLGAIRHWPAAGQVADRQLSVYTVRRLVDGTSSPTGRTIILLNYMNGQDYPLERLPQPVVEALEADEPGASRKNIVRMTRRQREIVFCDARQHALGVLYHLQNFVHDRAPDKTHSFRRFELSDEFGTPDRLPPKPYIRESLRLKAMYMMREQDGRNRDGDTKEAARERFAHVRYPDGLFAWQFHYDFHRTGRTYLRDEGSDGPWIDYHKPDRHTRFLSDRCTFPLRSLIPQRMDGLLGAQKNLGYSSIVSAALRLHDQGVAVGQAAGATAALSLQYGREPRDFPYQRQLLEAVRDRLCGGTAGALPLLLWPFRDLPAVDPAFVAINRLAAGGALPMDPREIDFRPQQFAADAWRATVVERSAQFKQLPDDLPIPRGEMTRGEFCRQWWATIAELPDRRWQRLTPVDADADGIPDVDDALLFTPNEPIEFKIETEPLPPDGDGMPPAAFPDGARTFNFCGTGTRSPATFVNDYGHRFDAQRGFGWSRDLSANHRRRRALEGVPRDTFIFTRQRDTWRCRTANGRYRVLICIGDSGHEQQGQTVVVEGAEVFREVFTARGAFAERAIEVTVRDGELTVDIGSGKPGCNTCLNWLQMVRLDAAGD